MDWLIDWWIGWLIDGLGNLWIDWLIDWLVGWLIDWLIRYLFEELQISRLCLLPKPLAISILFEVSSVLPHLMCLKGLSRESESVVVTWYRPRHVTMILQCCWWEFWLHDTDVLIILIILSIISEFLRVRPLRYLRFQIGCVFAEYDLFKT